MVFTFKMLGKRFGMLVTLLDIAAIQTSFLEAVTTQIVEVTEHGDLKFQNAKVS